MNGEGGLGSIPINIYSGSIYQGVTYFEIDGKGNYKGLTVIRDHDKDCVNLNQPGWTGKIYRIEDSTYAAWNDGTYDAFYLINMSKDGLVGTSYLIGGYNIAGIDERNDFYRKSNSFNFNNVLRLYEQFYCK